MIEPSVTLQFSEEKNEFRYLYLTEEPAFDFVTIDVEIGITDAVAFVKFCRNEIERPLKLSECISLFEEWINPNE